MSRTERRILGRRIDPETRTTDRFCDEGSIRVLWVEDGRAGCPYGKTCALCKPYRSEAQMSRKKAHRTLTQIKHTRDWYSDAL